MRQFHFFRPAIALVALTFLAVSSSGLSARAADATPAVSSVSGVVQDSTTQAPVAGIQVIIADDGSGTIKAVPGAATAIGRPAAATDANGRYEIQFTIDSRERRSISVSTLSNRFTYAGVQVGLYQGESAEAPPLVVSAFATVRGRVVDPEGKPVAGAVLNEHTAHEITTDADGRFTDDQVPPHRMVWHVAARGFRQVSYPYWVGDANAGEPVIRLTPCKPILGKIVAAPGAPLKGVVVYAGVLPYVNVLPNWQVPVDDQGNFKMDILPEKDQPFYLFPVRDREVAGQPVQMTAGEAEATLKLYSVGGIEVTVTDPAGKPVPQARIATSVSLPNGGDDQTKSRWATTDDAGKAVIANAPAGGTRVRLVGWPSAAQRTLTPGADAFVTVEPGATIKCALALIAIPVKDQPLTLRGVLVDEKGQPVRNATVGACRKDDLTMPQLYRGTASTQVDGAFEIQMYFDAGMGRDGLRPKGWEPMLPTQPGQVRVSAMLFEYRESILDVSRDWPKGEKFLDMGTLTVSIPAERIFTLQGTRTGSEKLLVAIASCTDAEGQPVAFRNVGPAWAEPSAAPALRFGVRKAVALKVQARDDLGQTVELSIAADADPAVPLKVNFPQARKMEFIIRDEAGNPAEGVQFIGRSLKPPFTFPQASGHTYVSDREGRVEFEVAREASGEYLLFKDIAIEPVAGNVAPGTEPLSRELRVKKGDVIISGRVARADGTPVPAAQASMDISAGMVSTVISLTLDKEGSFSTPAAAGLKIKVRAWANTPQESLQGESESIDLTAGQRPTLNIVLAPRR